MGLTLSYPPGFADLSDSALAADEPALGIQIAKIYQNSAFSVARTEVFVGTYVNGDTVPLPVSPIDGYTYSENECFFMWGIRATTDQQSGWINGGSLFYTAYKVDQVTGFDVSGNPTTFGKVYVDEWYCNPPPNTDLKHTNDGQLIVYTIAQRGQGSILVASSPSYSGITGSTVAQDKPLTQLLAQSINDDAKFACLDHEIFYLGEFYNGQTVPMPVSPADGYHYSAAECKFMHSWRWTAFGATNPMVQPPQSIGQLSYQQATVNSSGVVTCAVWFVDLSGNLFQYFTYGRIAVFAFCQRQGTGSPLSGGTPTSLTPEAINFAEIPIADFMPGQDLPSGTIQQIINNTQQGMLTPEFFGPTDYADGSTIPLPTSPIDGYAYSRAECSYLWEWTTTQNDLGNHARVPLFWAIVNQTTGAVQLQVWRLPPGGPYVDSNNTLCRIRVLVVARRNAEAVSLAPPASVNPASGATSTANPDAGAYATVEQAGVAVPQEKILNFLAPITVTDDPANSSSDVAVPVMIGDTASPSVGGVKGLVPAPPINSAAAGYFLKADGTWENPTSGDATIQGVQEELYNYADDTGTANHVVLALTPPLGAPIEGTRVTFKALNNNSGATDLALDGTAAKSIVKNGSTALVSGDIVAGTIYIVTYDGTNWQMVSGGGGSGGFTNPMTTLGDLIYENATPAAARLAGNTTSTRKFLRQTGTGSVSAAPAWDTVAAPDVSPLTTKGDLWGYDSANNRVAVGSDGQVLTADSSNSKGVSWKNEPYDLVYTLAGLPPNNTRYLVCVFNRSVSFSGNFSGSHGYCLTNPTATATYTLEKNGVNCGTVSISTSGVFTFTSSSGSPVSFAAGDRLTVVTPSPQDTTLADAGFTLAGTR